jgi:hypothetical protein
MTSSANTTTANHSLPTKPPAIMMKDSLQLASTLESLFPIDAAIVAE